MAVVLAIITVLYLIGSWLVKMFVDSFLFEGIILLNLDKIVIKGFKLHLIINLINARKVPFE